MSSVAELEQRIQTARIDELLNAIRPANVEHGGGCPHCPADAWAIDTAIWVCDNGHRGTIFGLRDHVSADPDRLTRLLGHTLRTLCGEPLHPPVTDHLPPVVDDWATPTDLFTQTIRYGGLAGPEQTDWCRAFAEIHGTQLLLELLEDLDDLWLTTALIDIRTLLRNHPAAA